MYARITRVKADPAGIDRLTEQLKAQMVPVFEQQKGYLGVVNGVNRETGEGATTTYWDTMENLKASEAAIFAARDKFAQEQGTEVISVHRCEIPIFERRGDPAAGRFTRVVAMAGIRPDQIDEGVRRFRDDAAPVTLAQPGCVAAILAVDRENSLAFAVSVWDSAEHREASDAVLRPIREAAAGAIGATPMTMNTESTLVEFKAPAPA